MSVRGSRQPRPDPEPIRMILCAGCGTIGYRGDRFCACCGGRLGGGCSFCGAPVLHPIAHFCTWCGGSLSARTPDSSAGSSPRD